MARHHTSTGAFYSFVTRGLRQPAGGAAAMIALLGYNAMQIGLYGLFGAAASGLGRRLMTARTRVAVACKATSSSTVSTSQSCGR